MSLTYEAARDFLYREARYLDDKQWDEWLELYASDATFWMPAWTTATSWWKTRRPRSR